MPDSLIGKKVLVTAASAGLGAAIARAFAAAGASVVVNYSRNTERAERLVEELASLRPATGAAEARYAAICADMIDKEAIYGLVAASVERLGGRGLDVVVSNQGWTRFTDFSDLDANVDEADWDRCFQVNVKSHLWVFHAARAHLEACDGAFVSVASTAGIVPGGSSLPYSVTKAALIHLIRGLAKTASDRIRVNSVSPGIMLTEWGRQFPQAKLDAAISQSPLKRLAAVEDVAEQVLFFARTRSLTGTNAIVDAGWSVGL